MREAAAQFLGKLFTRPDIQKKKILVEFIDYSLKTLKNEKNNTVDTFFICGLYYALGQIFKRVQRSELLPLIFPVLDQLEN